MSYGRFLFNPQTILLGSNISRPIVSTVSLHSPAAVNNTSGSPFGGTMRFTMVMGNTGCNDLSVVYQSYYTNEGATGATEKFGSLGIISFVNVTIEYNGQIYQCYLNGSQSFTLAPGATVITDPLAINIPPGATFYVRSCLSWPNNSFAPKATTWSPGGVSPYWSLYNNSITDTTGSTGTAGLFLGPGATVAMTPTCIVGTPMIPGVTNPTVGVVGDSIYDGAFATDNYSSHPVAALLGNKIQFHKGTIPSETGTSFLVDFNSTRRMLLFGQCNTIICNYGSNDIYLSPPLLSTAQMKTLLLALWAKLARTNGAKILQDTILPRCTNNATPASSQVFANSGGEVIRQAINAWLRAPASAGAGVSAMYDAGGILTGIFDSASYVETDNTNAVPGGVTNPNLGGKWYCGVGNNVSMTQDGVHPINSTYQYLSQFIYMNAVGTFASLPTKFT
jgi:hypothetical protein